MTNTTLAADAVVGLDLSAYLTTDVKRSIAFYRDVLGMTPTDIDEQGRGAEFTLADGQTFGVWDTGKNKTGAMAMLAVRDAGAAIARIRGAGGQISDAEEVPGCCAMAFGADPDGNGYIIHARNGRDAGTVLNPSSNAADPADIVGLDISGYATKDAAKAIAFYRDVIGIAPTGIDDEGRGSEFELADGTCFGVWNGGDMYSGGVMFAVGDISAAVARIRSRGGELADPFESPVCHMAFGKDPDGNDYIIHQRK